MEERKDIDVLSEKMKGALVVEVKEETWRKVEDSFRLAVVLHLCDGRSVNAAGLVAALKKAWNIEGKLKYQEWEHNRVVVKLRSEEELKRVLEGGPWLFDGWAVIAEKWRSGAKPLDYSASKVRLWMQLHNFPMELGEVMVPQQLAELAGRVIKDESQDSNKDKHRRKWPRFRVEVEVSDPIFPGCYLKLRDGRYIWLDFKYERLPNICFKCGRMIHETSQCQYEVEAEQSKRYGVWLKADRQGSSVPQVEGEHSGLATEDGGREAEGAGCTGGGVSQAGVDDGHGELGSQTRRTSVSDSGSLGGVMSAATAILSEDMELQTDVGRCAVAGMEGRFSILRRGLAQMLVGFLIWDSWAHEFMLAGRCVLGGARVKMLMDLIWE
ncbi:unnamed protein product [Rhodiola kirilowii]